MSPNVPILITIAALMVPAIRDEPKIAQDAVVPGIEVLLAEKLDLIRGKRIGLITNHTGIDRQGHHDIDLLRAAPGVKLVALFSPEHGIRGKALAGEPVGDETDSASGLPVFSLYGKAKRPTREMLSHVEVLLYDIQDLGLRFYTYISTLQECLEAAAQQGIPFIVLDRPNPLGGEILDGGMLDPRFRSFVGAYEIPMRYGLTAGELALYYNDGHKLNVRLEVVRMNSWRREAWYDETGLPWVAPSPNIPDLETALVYSGMCLLEGTNLSEGRGTSEPFRTAGAPWVDGRWLACALNGCGLAGVKIQPASFVPKTSKYAGHPCNGISLQVVDRKLFRPLPAAIELIRCVRKKYPEQFRWNSEHFDRLAGSGQLRLAIEQDQTTEEILQAWRPALREFDMHRKEHLLYR